MLRKSITALTLLLAVLLATAASSQSPKKIAYSGGMHPEAQIAFVKNQIKNKKEPFLAGYKQLLAHADTAKTHPTHELADFKVPGYYIDSAGHRRNSKSLQSDSFDAYASALAYRLSGDKKYADQALRFMKAWAGLNKSYSEHDGSLVMAYSGTAMVIAGQLMVGYSGWKSADQDQFSHWVKHVYLKSADEIRNRQNNWADWGRLSSILSADLLKDEAQIQENIKLIKSDLFEKIVADGSMPHETKRGKNGIWYTYFSLAPITAACWVAYNKTGENIFTFSQENRSLKTALDYLYHYNLHPKEWKWFEGVRPGKPDHWPGNLFEVMGEVYGDQRYTKYAAPAQPICISTHHFAWTFPSLMKVSLNGYKGNK